MTGLAGLELRDRAFRYVAEHASATDEEVLAHVYGGPTPAALRATLADPLLTDPRLERRPDGRWGVRSAAASTGFIALTIVASGPSPGRAHLVKLVALHIQAEDVVERFDVTLDPGVRVPRYALDRLGLAARSPAGPTSLWRCSGRPRALFQRLSRPGSRRRAHLGVRGRRGAPPGSHPRPAGADRLQ